MELVKRDNKGHFKKGEPSAFKGRQHTKEAKEKNRQAHIGMLSGINHPIYGKHRNQETKDKISNTLIGNIPWNKGKKIQSNTGRTHFKLNNIPWNKDKKLTEEHIKKCLTKKIPSSLEDKFQRIINKYNLSYKYVGDGSFIIENCNPDFINTNNKKIAIEVYARYYKLRNNKSIEEWKEKRQKVFDKYSWKIIYFNEIEVNEKNVLNVLGGV